MCNSWSANARHCTARLPRPSSVSTPRASRRTWQISPPIFLKRVWEQALEYGQRAGEQAQALYAPQAATLHFTRALEAARQLSLTPPASLYRARGLAYETQGDFERARADQETA